MQRKLLRHFWLLAIWFVCGVGNAMQAPCCESMGAHAMNTQQYVPNTIYANEDCCWSCLKPRSKTTACCAMVTCFRCYGECSSCYTCWSECCSAKQGATSVCLQRWCQEEEDKSKVECICCCNRVCWISHENSCCCVMCVVRPSRLSAVCDHCTSRELPQSLEDAKKVCDLNAVKRLHDQRRIDHQRYYEQKTMETKCCCDGDCCPCDCCNECFEGWCPKHKGVRSDVAYQAECACGTCFLCVPWMFPIASTFLTSYQNTYNYVDFAQIVLQVGDEGEVSKLDTLFHQGFILAVGQLSLCGEVVKEKIAFFYKAMFTYAHCFNWGEVDGYQRNIFYMLDPASESVRDDQRALFWNCFFDYIETRNPMKAHGYNYPEFRKKAAQLCQMQGRSRVTLLQSFAAKGLTIFAAKLKTLLDEESDSD